MVGSGAPVEQGLAQLLHDHVAILFWVHSTSRVLGVKERIDMHDGGVVADGQNLSLPSAQ